MTNRRHTFYQMVMRRLVRRYIHQSRKTMRQDGVSEDDLLEIKQDISSLRYELREDRKREVARTIGHLEGLKREIVSELRNQFQTCGSIKATALDPTTKHESESLTSTSPEKTEDKARQHTQAGIGARKTFKQSELLARPHSLAYGQETQCIYDEIKQLALINTAYERSKQTVLPSQALPVSTYTSLKDEIIQGVRSELVGVIKQLCEVHDPLGSGALEPRGTLAQPIPSTSRIVLQHDQVARGEAHVRTSGPSRPQPLRSALSVTQTPRAIDFRSEHSHSRGVSRQMSTQYLGSSARTFVCPMGTSESHPLRPIFRRAHPPLNEWDSDSSGSRPEKRGEEPTR